MRILFIIPEEFEGNRWGGVTAHTSKLARELCKQWHTTFMLTSGAKDELQARDWVRIYKIAHAK